MSQLSYTKNMAAAFAGMLADARTKIAETYLQGEASAEIPFGVAVAEGAIGANGTPNKGILMVDATSVIAGVLMHQHTYAKDNELGTTGLKPLVPMTLVKRGLMWVIVEDAVTKDNTAFVRHTANGAGKLQKGAFRSDADTANAIKARGFTYRSSTTGAGIALVEVDVNLYRSLIGVTGY